MSGDGLISGRTDRQAQFTIAAKHANLYHEKKLVVDITHDSRTPRKPSVDEDHVAGTQSAGQVDVQVLDNDDGTYSVKYQARQGGTHIISVLYQGQHVPGSPFHTSITQAAEASACQISAPWLQSKKLPVGQETEITVLTETAGDGHMEALLVDPSQHQEGLSVCHDEAANAKKIRLKCTVLGQHQLTIKWDDHHVPGSPLKFMAIPPTSPHHVLVRAERHDLLDCCFYELVSFPSYWFPQQ